MVKNVVLGLGVLVCACAAVKNSAVESAAQRPTTEVAPKRGDAHPLYVGRGSDGELVMASSHHDAMNGLAVAGQEIGVTSGQDGDFICKRETVTGTHMPQWICRYKAEVEEDRIRTQRMLDNLPRGCMDKSCLGQ
jgi:phosphoglucomutase